MNHKNLLIIAAILTVSCQDAVPLYKQADAPIEKRVEDLLSRMTLEEKILQMNEEINNSKLELQEYFAEDKQ